MDEKYSIVIAGGGIAGLSCALSLNKRGQDAVVVEKTQQFSEVGAGIQLGPNAARILHHLGLQNALEEHAFQPEGLMIFDGIRGKQLNTIPLKQSSEKIFGAPYYTIHRADLQNILLKTLHDIKRTEIICDFEVETIACANSNNNDEAKKNPTLPIELHSAEKTSSSKSIIADHLVGADGIWSRVRKHVMQNVSPRFSGKTAWRALLPISEVPESFYASHIGLWLGHNAHLVHYPVKSGQMLNIVAVIDDQWAKPGWHENGQAELLNSAFSEWSEHTHRLLSVVQSWKKWALFELPVPKRWNYGPITLIGDAVHPMLPFLAQGGAMAIEDSITFAKYVDRKKRFLEPLDLERYQDARFKRTSRVQKKARNLGIIYHYKGLMAQARNIIIAKRAPISLLKDYSWLYNDSV
ncbi:MAG: FAD-dependent monooxygenase [Pseudomonadota bacterium]